MFTYLIRYSSIHAANVLRNDAIAPPRQPVLTNSITTTKNKTRQAIRLNELFVQCQAYLDALPGGDFTTQEQQAIHDDLSMTLQRKRYVCVCLCLYALRAAI